MNPSVNLLALESSSDLLTVALGFEGEVIERAAPPGALHSAMLLPLIESLLAEQGIGLAALDGIAYGEGPGAFTGVRLACSVAQGLALGRGLPLVGIGSLEALALELGEGKVYACMDARMNEVYCAAYEVAAGVVNQILAPEVSAPGTAPLPPAGSWRGGGSGFAAYPEALAARLEPCLGAVDASVRPRAASVLRLAAPRFSRGEAQGAAQAITRYVRDKVALTTRERIAAGGKA